MASFRGAWAQALRTIWSAPRAAACCARTFASASTAEEATSKLNPRQVYKRTVIPETKNRNQAHRMWQKSLRIEWQAKEQRENRKEAARQLQAARIARWRQRAAFKAEAHASATAQ
ncbi:hypothetical protein H632_c3055p1 [Helicosporidium sp. ATCC 50920]|nr:hypothetical protein H632_c3055p1 [Helicosporidium sp. ATCC 50920]|eukprot:KDD72664.1 hypothetical protein H632_c3055p1 [Helicosporidium sp. ATCC 50920]